MKIRLATVIGAAAACMLCVTARPRGAAERRRPAAEPVRVIWVRPDLVPAPRRPALAHLLAAAAAGEPLRGDCVRDSRPQVDGPWLVTPGRKHGEEAESAGGAAGALTGKRGRRSTRVQREGERRKL